MSHPLSLSIAYPLSFVIICIYCITLILNDKSRGICTQKLIHVTRCIMLLVSQGYLYGLCSYLIFVSRLVDVRSFAFVVARALVTEVKKLQQGSSNGQLQPDDVLNFFSSSHVEVYHPELLFHLQVVGSHHFYGEAQCRQLLNE